MFETAKIDDWDIQLNLNMDDQMYSITHIESKSRHLCHFLQLFVDAGEFKNEQRADNFTEYNKHM